jgi:hypothetical protein
VDQVLRKVKWGEFAAPRQIDRSIDPALAGICTKAMAFTPENRYQTSRALADDIERWTAGLPITAWDERLPRRMWRWTRRAMPAAAVAMFAGLVGLAMLAGHQTRANREIRKAHAAATIALQGSQELLDEAGTQLVGLYDASGEKAKADHWRKRLAAAPGTTRPKP